MEQKFNLLLEEVKNDPNILGFWLSGSRGKGLITEKSDYDCVILVKDEVFTDYREKFKEREDENFEFFIKTMQTFQDQTKWGSDQRWNRYSYTHVKPLVDKTEGEIEKLFAEVSVIPPDKIKEVVSGYLDAYINQIYRSLKCLRDGNLIASHLEASESVSFLISALFGLEGRLKPYYKYIQWELKNYPLKDLPWSTDEFLEKVIRILSSGDKSTQQEVLKSIEPIFRENNYGGVFDAWKEKLMWMKTYN
ncbi:MAG TPA: nucleotidyltransferase domain-containing protein [Candidatus Paceibacterota bacterium]